MTFIEISNTVCVNKHQVAWVKKTEDGFCIVFVGGIEYPSDMPYEILVDMLQQKDINSTEEKLDKYLSVATITTV